MTEPDDDEDARLNQLYARYDYMKPLADSINEDLKMITDAIKVEETRRHPGERLITIRHPNLSTPLTLRYVKSWRLDAKRMRAEDPATYVRYAVPSERWELRTASGGAQ